jgi:hypothetical protein
MKKVLFTLLAFALAAGWASPGWAAGLKLTIHDGRVSLDAQDVTVRQILAEWARVGRTRIVNLERVSSGQVTLRFEGLPEDQALDIILRTVPGFMAAPRAAAVSDASMYDRIMILPTTTAVAAVTPPRASTQAGAAYQDPSPNVTQLRPAPLQLNPGVLPEPQDDPRDSSDAAIAAAAASGLIAAPGQPFGTNPPSGALQPPVRNAGTAAPTARPQVPATPSNPWNAPAGTSRPGMAPPPPPPSTNAPPTVPAGGPRPQQADQ